MSSIKRPASRKEQWALEARAIRGLPQGKDYLVDIRGRHKAHRFGIHYHPEYMELVYTINGVEYSCPTGTVLLVRAGDFHDTFSEHVNFSNIVFHQNELERLLQDARNAESRQAFRELLWQEKPFIGKMPESQREQYIEALHHLVPLQAPPRLPGPSDLSQRSHQPLPPARNHTRHHSPRRARLAGPLPL